MLYFEVLLKAYWNDVIYKIMEIPYNTKHNLFYIIIFTASILIDIKKYTLY